VKKQLRRMFVCAALAILAFASRPATAAQTVAGVVDQIVESMTVLPMGYNRLVTRNIFDVCVNTPMMPGEYPPTNTDGAIGGGLTTVPPRFEYENFEWDDNDYDNGWPHVKGERYGAVYAGAIWRKDRLRAGIAAPYHKIKPRTTHMLAPGTELRAKADIDVAGVAAFGAYEVLSEAHEQPVTLDCGVAGGWIHYSSDIDATVTVAPSTMMPGGAVDKSDNTREHNIGVGAPFARVDKNAGFCHVGFSSLYMVAVTDKGNKWISHEILTGPYVAVPIGDRLTVGTQLLHAHVLSDDRDGDWDAQENYDKSHYVADAHAGVAITDFLKVYAGFRYFFGMKDYKAWQVFGGAALIF